MSQPLVTEFTDGAAPNDGWAVLILASSSPRRRELLTLMGLPFEVVPSRFLEPPAPPHPVRLSDFVIELATEKAREVAQRTPGALVLGADTLVTLALEETGVALGKPADAQEARRMLAMLSGKWHAVYTGLALLRTSPEGGIDNTLQVSVRSRVKFRDLTERMIADYVATGEPLDKAGAYGAQGYAAPFIESFEGDFYNVVGLPLCAFGQLLERSGLEWWRFRAHIPHACG